MADYTSRSAPDPPMPSVEELNAEIDSLKEELLKEQSTNYFLAYQSTKQERDRAFELFEKAHKERECYKQALELISQLQSAPEYNKIAGEALEQCKQNNENPG